MSFPSFLFLLPPLLLFAAARLAPLDLPTVALEGELLVLTTQPEAPDIPRYWVKMDERDVRPVLAPNETIMEKLQTGDIVRIYTSLMPNVPLPFPSARLPIYTDLIEPILQREPIPPVDTNISSIAFVLNVCNATTPNSVNHTRDMWFRAPQNLRAYFRNCSYDKLDFPPEHNIVVGPIDVPCDVEGVFDSHTCGMTSIYGWMQYAEAHAHDVLKIDIHKYQHRIALLPPKLACLWAGLGTVGCGSACYTWIHGDFAKLPVIFHELGHNLGLVHSAHNGYEYGDGTCAMGVQRQPVCFNAPHNHVLRWAEPLADLRYPLAKREHVTLPLAQAQPRNFVRLSNPKDAEALYVSYRGPVGYDAWLDEEFRYAVVVHASAAENLPERRRTSLLFVSSPPGANVYDDRNSRVRITVASTNRTHAVVRFDNYG